jgi:hypothetical protein
MVDTYSLSRSPPYSLPLPKHHSTRLHILSSHPSWIPHLPTLQNYPPHTIRNHLLADRNLSAPSPTGLSQVQVTQVVDRAYYPLQAGLSVIVSIIVVLDGRHRQIVGDQVSRSHLHREVVSRWHQAIDLNQGSKRRAFSVDSYVNRALSRKPRQMNRSLKSIRCLSFPHAMALSLRNGFYPLLLHGKDHWKSSAVQLQGERSVQSTG